MIAFLRGNFVDKSPSSVIVDVNGVGYELQISLNTFSAIENKENGVLETYLHITENGQTLYGFASKQEKQMFLFLISVSGVGTSTARMMLSGLKAEEVASAIVDGNLARLSSIKGIGKKTAERIVVELKDKLSKKMEGVLRVGDAEISMPKNIYMDATDALVALGINRASAEASVKKIMSTQHSENDNTIKLEDLIKQALKLV